MTAKKSLTANLSLSKRAVLYVLVPFALQIILFTALSAFLEESVRQEEQEHRSKSLIARANWLAVICLSANLGTVAHALTGDPLYKSVFTRCQDFLSLEKREMPSLVEANKREELETVTKIGQRSTALFDILAHAEKLTDEQDSTVGEKAAISYMLKSDLKNIWQELNQLRHTLLKLDRESFALSPNAIPAKLKLARNVMYIFVLADIVVAVFFIWRYGKDIASRLKSMTENTKRFAAGEDLHAPVSGNDELNQLDVSFHDMTDLLKAAKARELAAYEALQVSQAKFKNLVERMPLGLIALDEHNRVTLVNPVAAELLGQTAEQIAGKKISDYFIDEKNALAESLADDKTPERRLELVAKKDDESEFPAEIVITGNTGEEQRRIVSVQDISQRYEIERLKSEFFAMVTHDLKTPLTTIKATLMMLPTGHFGALNEKGASRVQAGINETNRLTRLVDDLLDTARLEAGKFDLEQDFHTVDTIIASSVTAASEFAARNHVSLEVEPMALMVYCDCDRIIQVLFNLLTNAIKYSPSGSKVKVTCEDQVDWARISVQDSGRGIPKSHLDIVFEKFGQVERSDARLKGGTGLGLAICKAIVEQHRGTIGAVSELGEGSTFWFTIPTAKAERERNLKLQSGEV